MAITTRISSLAIASLFVLLFITVINLSTSSHVTANSPAANARTAQEDDIAPEPTEDDSDQDEGEELDDEEDWNDEGDMEDQMEFIEIEKMEIETNIGRLEAINRLAEIAKDDTAMASYAIMHLEEFVENEDEAINLLNEMIQSSQVSGPVKNLLKMKLAEVYSWQDRQEDAMKIFKSMLLTK